MVQKLRILIVRLSAIGDVVHGLPVLSAIKSKFPDSYIGWAVEDKAADLLINHPLIDKLHIMPKSRWKNEKFSFNTIKEIFSFVKTIKNERYDIAIDLQELLKSSLIAFLSGAKRRIAHDKTREFAHLFINEKLPYHNIFDPNRLVIDRYLEPAKHLGADIKEIKFTLPPTEKEIIDYIDFLLEDIDKEKPVIILSPATMWQSKHWPEEYWAMLIEALCEENNIVLTGSNADETLISRITNQLKNKNFLSLVGKTNIKQLIELMRRADIVIAPDTGPAHIANAVDKPKIITVFGPTSNKRTCPVGENHTALSANISCQPCNKKKCPLGKDFMDCMKKITPDKVLEHVLCFKDVKKNTISIYKSVI